MTRTTRPDELPDIGDFSGLDGHRIVVVATGAPGTAFLPSWVTWLPQVAPSAELRLVLTRSARSFVGVAALRAFTGDEPLIDSWDEAGSGPLHVELAQWADGWLVHPATMHFVSRLAAGLCDSPAMLAMQGTRVPIVVAASAPPGFVHSPVWEGYLRAFEHRPNVQLLTPLAGISTHDSSLVGSPPAIFPHAAAALSTALTGAEVGAA